MAQYQLNVLLFVGIAQDAEQPQKLDATGVMVQLIAANLTLSFDKQTTRTHIYGQHYTTPWYRERCSVDHKLTVLV